VSTVATVIAILASAVIVLGGLVALVRAIWRIAQNLRDNTKATQDLTGKMDHLTTSIDGRFDALAERVARLEGKAGP
jgi:predicted PurR-regulated permease PerM